ncbi:MAG: PAS domain S-box protein [Candidatus Wallbacteria bacterium]
MIQIKIHILNQKKIHILRDSELNYINTINEIVKNFIINDSELFELKLLSYATKSVRDCIYVTNMLGVILYINQAFVKTYGYNEDEILGHSSERLFKKNLSENDIENVFVHSSETGWTGESIAIKKDGTEFEIAFSISYVHDDKNEIIGLVVIVNDITELKKLQKKIKENEERYKQMFEKHFAVKLLIDIENGSIIDANQSASSFYGYDINELKKMNITQITLESYEQILRKVHEINEFGNKFFYSQQRMSSGKVKDVNIFCGIIVVDNKKYLYLIIIDITEKIIQERVFKETEIKYAAIFENTGTALLILDSELTIVLANREFQKISGFTKQELESKRNFLDFVAIDDIEMLKKYNNLSIINTSAAPGNYKFQFIDANNNIKDILLRISLINQTNQRIASLQDITETEMQKQELSLNEARLEALLKLSKMENVSTIEIIKFVLEEAIKLTKSKFGYIASVDEKEDSVYIEAFSKLTRENFKISEANLVFKISENIKWQNIIQTKKYFCSNIHENIDNKNLSFSRLHSWFRKQIIVPVINDEKVVMIVCVANKWDDYNDSDIRHLTLLMEGTWHIIKQKAAEKSIKEANAKLMELDKLKNAFLSNVSHELRTPLTSISGFSKIITKKMNQIIIPGYKGDDEKILKNFKQISANLSIMVEECDRLTHLVNQILDIQKIESDDFTYKFEYIDIIKCIKKAIESTCTLIDSKKINLTVDLKKDAIRMYGDFERILQLMINLLSNAIKFTYENGSIGIFADSDEKNVIVKVADSGVGIKEEDLKFIFERFKQADNSINFKNKNAGTGLGLTICQQIVNKHGGNIWAESELNCGSVFSFIIPLDNKVGGVYEI